MRGAKPNTIDPKTCDIEGLKQKTALSVGILDDVSISLGNSHWIIAKYDLPGLIEKLLFLVETRDIHG